VRSFGFLQRTNPDQERDEGGVKCWYEDEEEDNRAGPSRVQEGDRRMEGQEGDGYRRRSIQGDFGRNGSRINANGDGDGYGNSNGRNPDLEVLQARVGEFSSHAEGSNNS
jgi:hypothetical protein